MAKKTKDVKVVTEAEATQMAQATPLDTDPEVLAKRKDDLEEAAETLSNEKEHYKIDPAASAPDREILDSYEKGYGDITNAQSDRRYLWAYYGQNAQQVWAAKALGWRVVTGNDPECVELKEVDGTRRFGDTMLMWTTIERYEELKRLEERRRTMQQAGVTSKLIELGDNARGHGIRVITDPGDREMHRGGSLMDTMQKRAAHSTVAPIRDKMLKEGNVPGMPTPGGQE